MRAISVRRQEQVLAVVSLHGGWVRLLEARVGEKGPVSLLSMKARQAAVSPAGIVAGLDEGQTALLLKEMVGALPQAPREALALLSTGEMVTRYLTLPSEDPGELRRMAVFQLEGVLPFPAQECVTSVKVLGPAGEATRVLAAAVHRPAVERLVRICSGAGLALTGILPSSEGVGSWHRACWRAGLRLPEVWLVAERSRDGLDVGILAQGSLIYMRQVHHLGGDVEELIRLLQETMRAYAREQVGPPARQISLSGWLEGLGPGFAERMEQALGIPVQQVDPLEQSPFRESLSVTARELAPEVSFTELLGAACAPRMLGLDLLPAEIRWQQARQQMARDLRLTALLAAAAALLLAGWAGGRVAATWWAGRQLDGQISALEPQVARIRAAASQVRGVYLARRQYASQMEWLAGAVRGLSDGMKLRFLGMEARGLVTLRGMAPDLGAVTRYAAALREGRLWDSVELRSAKRDADKGEQVEFELVLRPREAR